MIITDIERSKKSKDQMLVFVDGEYCFSINEEDYLRLNLYEKREITLEEINHIRNIINLGQAKALAVRYLALKIRSEREVREKLEQEGFDASTIDNAVEELKAIGYINDKMYAQKYIFDRSKLKPKAKRMLKYELENKGIDRYVIDDVLEDWAIDESVVAEGLVRKKFGKYDLQDEQVLKKMYAFLKHRGFSNGIIMGLINKIKAREYEL